MTEAMTPAEALRATADNLDSGLAAMEGLEVQIGGGPWKEPSHKDGVFLAINLVDGKVQIRRKPVPTPAQQAGWKVGDVGRHESGVIVSLYEDFGDYDLLWRVIKNDAKIYSYLSTVERLIPESECK